MDFQLLRRGIKYPYAVISDVHLHAWSAFSHTNENKENSRLRIILDAIRDVCAELMGHGGNDLIITGDLFHQRGYIKPSVLNPTVDLFKELTAHDINVHCIPGNHDMEGNNSEKIGSAIHSLSTIPGFNVYNEPTIVDDRFMFIPWFEHSRQVLDLTTKGSNLFPNLTLFCHVGMSGVLPTGKIGNIINPDDFAKLDLKYVFSGHFHNHTCFHSRIYSVGALTHQTWNDSGSLAGYLIVHEDKVEHFETQAPKFLTNPVINIGGNYIRLKDMELTDEEAADAITKLKEIGALAVQDLSVRPSMIKVSATTEIKVSEGLTEAIKSFAKAKYGDIAEAVAIEAQRIRDSV